MRSEVVGSTCEETLVRWCATQHIPSLVRVVALPRTQFVQSFLLTKTLAWQSGKTGKRDAVQAIMDDFIRFESEARKRESSPSDTRRFSEAVAGLDQSSPYAAL